MHMWSEMETQNRQNLNKSAKNVVSGGTSGEMSENRKHFSKFRPSQTLQIELSLKRELDFHCFARSLKSAQKGTKWASILVRFP